MGGPARILIVDDSPDMTMLIGMLIESMDGFEVTASAVDAESGRLAWREHRPDIVLLDQRLPDADGTDLALEIRHDVPDALIVLCTSHDEGELPEAPGVHHVLSKTDLTKLPEILPKLVRP